jgi:CRP-like cAMP-binding protein
MESIVDILGKTPPFAGSAMEHLRVLAEGAELMDVERGQRFIRAGDPPDRLFLLFEGSSCVFHEHSDGRRVTVKHLFSPATLGEMQVIAGLAFVENAEALTPARLVRLRGPALGAYLDRCHRATRALLGEVCGRFCVAARNERAILFEVPSRLAGLLLTYADAFGVEVPEGLMVRYPLTQRTLADGLGVVERSVRRAIAEWKKAGMITTKKGWFVIRDLEAMDRISGELRFSINYRPDVDLDRLRSGTR